MIEGNILEQILQGGGRKVLDENDVNGYSNGYGTIEETGEGEDDGRTIKNINILNNVGYKVVKGGETFNSYPTFDQATITDEEYVSNNRVNKAFGEFSSASNLGTVANESSAETVVGQYNIATFNGTNNYGEIEERNYYDDFTIDKEKQIKIPTGYIENALFIIGDGLNSLNRHNLLTIASNCGDGDERYSSMAFEGRMDVEGPIRSDEYVYAPRIRTGGLWRDDESYEWNFIDDFWEDNEVTGNITALSKKMIKEQIQLLWDELKNKYVLISELKNRTVHEEDNPDSIDPILKDKGLIEIKKTSIGSTGNYYETAYINKGSSNEEIKLPQYFADGVILLSNMTFSHATQSGITTISSPAFKKVAYDKYGHLTSTSDVTASDIGDFIDAEYDLAVKDKNSKKVIYHTNSKIGKSSGKVFKKIEYSDYGHITGVSDVLTSDLPLKSGNGIELNTTSGEINHTNSVAAPVEKIFAKFEYDNCGHITSVDKVTKKDITDLGVPAQDTTYTFSYDDSTKTFTILPSTTTTKQTFTFEGTKYSAGTDLSLKDNTVFYHTISGVTAATTPVFQKFSYNDRGHITNATDVTKSDITTALGYIPSETDTNTTYTVVNKSGTIQLQSSDNTYTDIVVPGTGLTLSNKVLNHSNSITATDTTELKKIKYDSTGHITGTDDVTVSDLPLKDGFGITIDTSTGKINHSNSGIAAPTETSLKKIKYDSSGHISGVDKVTKSDITNLGIPAQDTTYTFTYDDTDEIITITSSTGDTTELDLSLEVGYGLTFTSSGTLVHRQTTGFYHIPSGGKEGQYLKYLSNGRAQWADLTITTDDSGAIVYTGDSTNYGTITVDASTITLSDAVGKTTDGDSYTVDATNYSGNSTSEIFNNYTGNKAAGSYSHAEGTLTSALANFSHAEGSGTIASGIASHAEGESSTVSGRSAHAEGSNTKASGNNSHTEGFNTKGVGLGSHAEGNATTASGNYAHSEGSGTIASANNQHVQGAYNEENDSMAFIIGNGTTTEARSNAFTVDWSGNTTAAGTVSAQNYYGKDGNEYVRINNTISGTKIADIIINGTTTSLYAPTTTSSGTTTMVTYSAGNGLTLNNNTFSHAIGSGWYHIPTGGSSGQILRWSSTGQAEWGSETTYKGKNTLYGTISVDSGVISISDAVGKESGSAGGEIFNDYSNNEAKATNAHAEGSGTTASANSAHAEGSSTKASGNYSHAEGLSTEASGVSAHAEGNSTTASGKYSHAEGSSTTASYEYCHAEGCKTEATGSCSHAEGWSTSARGGYDHVGGENSQTLSPCSFAHGWGLTAYNGCGTVVGRNNIYDTENESKDTFADKGYAFIVGNGRNSATYSNGFTVDWLGNVFCGVDEGDGNVTYGTVNGVDLRKLVAAVDALGGDVKDVIKS